MKRLLFISAILCVFAGFLAKDMVIGRIVARYIEKTFAAECAITKISIGPNQIKVKGIRFSRRQVRFSMEEGVFHVRWKDILHPVVTRVALSRAKFELTEEGMSSPDDKNPAGMPLLIPAAAVSYIDMPLPVMLSEVTFVNNVPQPPQVDVTFSFEGTISASGIETIDYLELIRGDIRTDTIQIEGATLNKSFDERREFHIPVLTIKEESFDDVRFPFIIQDDQMVFARQTYEFLGRTASLSGAVEFSDYKNFCLVLRCDDVSAEEVMRLLGDESGFLLRGNFQGKIRLCLSDGALTQLEGMLENGGGGFIHIKRDVPVEWLKAKFTEDSYEALLENFKNYTYNAGKFVLSQNGEKITISVHFDSKEKGKRNLTINLYDFL